ncbi:hypothetical protein [Streptomyces sp. LN785]|uniref:hypothetical protein n=1 Tax=Streptomyces sp. LN785 TaxID=3112983 RepID=UPI003720F715
MRTAARPLVASTFHAGLPSVARAHGAVAVNPGILLVTPSADPSPASRHPRAP